MAKREGKSQGCKENKTQTRKNTRTKNKDKEQGQVKKR